MSVRTTIIIITLLVGFAILHDRLVADDEQIRSANGIGNAPGWGGLNVAIDLAHGAILLFIVIVGSLVIAGWLKA